MKKMLMRGMAIAAAAAIVSLSTAALAEYTPMAEATAVTVDAYVSTSGYSADDTAFMLMSEELAVSSDEAEKYGYEDSLTSGVSALDVIVKLHEEMFGAEDFQTNKSTYLALKDGGWITAAFGDDGGNFGYAVNKAMVYSPYVEMTEGSRFEFFMYADKTGYTDTYVPHENMNVCKGETVEINASGAMFAWGMPAAAVEDIQLAYVNDNTLTAVNDSKTDENGNISVTFDTPGEYTLTFFGESVTGCPIMPSPFKVTVTDDATYNAYLATANTLNSDLAYGKEWEVIGLARGGFAIDADAYYTSVTGSIGDSARITEYAKAVLALGAAGKEIPENILAPLASYSKVSGYVTYAMYSLLALDSKNYTIPTNSDSEDQNTRQKMIDYILSQQIEGGGYGYTWGGTTYTDVDTTAMAIQSLAKYRSMPKVKEAIDSCLTLIENNTPSSPETYAQLIVAYDALGLDEKAAEAVTGLMQYYSEENGFTSSYTGGNSTITKQQALYALADYFRTLRGKTGLYDMNDYSGSEIKVFKDSEGGCTIYSPEDKSVVTAGASYKDGALANVSYNGEFELTKGTMNYFAPGFDASKIMVWDKDMKALYTAE